MSATGNDRLLRALRREPVDRTPVWLMRQAGRYLPEYREVRAEAGSFMALATNPELACRVTLQPLERFALDAAIIFSDILTVPDAMGLGLYFEPGEGPRFERPVRSAADIGKLRRPDPEQELGYVMDALRLTRRELDGRVPLIGFAGSPWTVATYMVEGGSSKQYAIIKEMLYRNPDDLHALLTSIADATGEYLRAQWQAGAQALMIFDTWGGMLSSAAYEAFSLAYMQRIVAQLKAAPGGAELPVILFTKGGCPWLEKMAGTGCDALGVDWTCDLSHARRRVGDRVALQGNLDPGVLYGDDDTVRQEVARTLASFGHGNGHVFNLGHGIHPGVDPERVGTLVAAVHELSRAYHG